ncbi:MAG: TonB-dependent receptor, partial [Azonexus sp.]|nr:TonB-dependent receptor [Azonexus sp.]
MYPRFKPSLLLLGSALTLPAFAVDTPQLENLVVTATRQPMRASEVLTDVSVVERSDIEAAGHSTLEDILARQPGLEITTNGSPGAASNLLIRGTNASHVLLLIDGVRMGSATSGNISWSRIPASQIERIEIVRGPASSLYGSDAIGGVVQIFTRRGDTPLRFSAEAGAGSYGTQAYSGGISGSSAGWRYALNLSRNQTDGFNSRPWTASANPDRDGFKNDVVSGQLGYEFARGHEINLGAFQSEAENQYDGTGALVDWRSQTREKSGYLSLKNAITANWRSTLTVAHSTDSTETIKDGVQTSLFKTDQRQYSWQNDIRSALGHFLLGAERLEQAVDTTTKYALTERSNDSLLAGWTYSLNSHRLQANLRHDDNSQFGKKTTGSAAYGYRFTPNWRANASYGTAFKAPTFNDLYYPLTAGFVGNPNLQPELAQNREASLHYEAGAHHVSLTWYLNHVNGLIIWPKTGLVRMPTNVANARLEGVTLAYEGNVHGFNLQASYDYLDAINSDTGKQLPQRAAHKASAAIGQQLGAWEWRAEVQAAAHRFNDEANAVRMGGYALTNLYGSYRVARDWSVFARINNLFDRDYVLIDTYAT